MDRALSNLIDNAIRHGGKTVVRLACAPGAVTVTVEDDGPGIPDGEKEAMLEPFVRGDAARGMNESAGFGLGLSIARSIVKKHGGTLVLRDRHPNGLMVVVTLPNDDAGGSRPCRSETANGGGSW